MILLFIKTISAAKDQDGDSLSVEHLALTNDILQLTTGKWKKEDHFSLFGTSLYTGVSTVPYILSFQICRGSIVFTGNSYGIPEESFKFCRFEVR